MRTIQSGDAIVVSASENGIYCIEFNRPKKLNTVSRSFQEEMSAAWALIDRDKSARVAVLTGKGSKAFCAGADIEDLLPPMIESVRARQQTFALGGISRENTVPIPTIAAINGCALGGGLELAMACDIRIATSSATFGLPEPKLGAIPGGGGTARILDLLPESIASEILLTGEPIAADCAFRFGLISQLVEPDNLMDAAMATASTIAQNSPAAISALLRIIRWGPSLSLNERMAMERREFEDLCRQPDIDEGIAAFLAKRPPKFRQNRERR